MRRTLPLGKRYTSITVCIIVVGLGLLASSAIIENDWYGNVAIEFGATLMLFAPLLILSQAMETRLRQFTEAQEEKFNQEIVKTNVNVANLASEVDQTKEEVRSVREDISEAVMQRLVEKRTEDRALFDRIENAPSREIVATALTRAKDLDLISNRGPRVCLRETDVYLRFAPGMAFGTYDGSVELFLEHQDGSALGNVRWARSMDGEEDTAVDVLVDLTEKVQAAGRYPGDAPYQAGAVFSDLRHILDLAYDRATGASGIREPIGPIVEIFSPQWALTDTTLKRLDGPYDIAIGRLSELDWWSHVIKKPWIDEVSFTLAFDTAKALYETGNLAPKPPGYVEEPPF
ncbi:MULTISPECIES: hypothetical protein [unclassified Pseudonocardia]|uniref:hypothetical protein n=1 Tax=unclassified Pseudonocardia TaxID=2619320 RepID=UPI00095BCCCC|nr:hypothetical protein [Pseudonocardia sp. Ae707_Ps1]OLM20118.1 hypothetical protein Ae707Ps1_4377 [Pseudonocardia sp. Ae707_Ps1]